MYKLSSQSGFVFKNGEKNNTAILLLHGLTGSPFEMHQYGKALCKEGYDVFCPILPGHCVGLESLKNAVWKDWYDFSLNEFDELSKKYEKVFISGLCMGSVLALCVAQERDNVSGIIGLSTTLFLDGKGIPWYRFLSHFAASTIFKFFYLFPETKTCGIKNENIRKRIANLQESNTSVLNCYPMLCVLEIMKFSSFARKKMHKVKTPVLLIHSIEDDFTSIKSAEFVYKNISSEKKELVKLENSYHVITLDNDKKFVTEKSIEFIKDSMQAEEYIAI